MHIETSDTVIEALRTSGLFDPERLEEMVRELRALETDDAMALMRHALHREWLTLYQLRKVLHGKAQELHLGPYLLVEKIGEGGMGKVYRARRVVDGRPVALKIVRPILLANPVIRKRYEREVATALTLRHPNIVEVFDAGEIDGRHYLAMEFVDGVDLSRLVKEHQALELAEACEYIRQAALGLHHAHEAGFVHRDIKPSNIVVAGERHLPHATEPAIVKILDMGLIRSIGFATEGTDGVDLTRSGTVVGTPDYMAPEQAKNSSTVDHRADLYSLGCTLYFLLAGRPPFPDGNAIEKILKHQFEAPLPLQALRPEIPTVLAEVVARLMARSPADRYPTARAAADALAPLARDLIGVVSPPPPRAQDSSTYPIAPERSGSAGRGAEMPQTLGLADDTPPTPERMRPRRAARKKESLSSLHEPPSSESFPAMKPVPETPPESYWRRNRGVLVAIGCWLVAFASVLFAVLRRGG
jgi:eukaryotic-like serine/threonine-protein kinase